MWAERVQVPIALMRSWMSTDWRFRMQPWRKRKELQANALLLACDNLFAEGSAVAGSRTCAGLELPLHKSISVSVFQ